MALARVRPASRADRTKRWRQNSGEACGRGGGAARSGRRAIARNASRRATSARAAHVEPAAQPVALARPIAVERGRCSQRQGGKADRQRNRCRPRPAPATAGRRVRRGPGCSAPLPPAGTGWRPSPRETAAPAGGVPPRRSARTCRDARRTSEELQDCGQIRSELAQARAAATSSSMPVLLLSDRALPSRDDRGPRCRLQAPPWR